MSNKVEQFINDKFGEVRTIKDDNCDIWFVAKDIAKVLKYSTTQKVTYKLEDDEIIHLHKHELNNFGYEQTGGKKVILINKNGLHKVLSSNRKITTKEKIEIYKFLTSNDFYSDLSWQSKESKFLEMLEEALKPFGLRGIKQLKVLDKYRLDFYLPSLNIAVEFDENFHRGYNMEAHEFRQKEIEEELDIEFIRVSDKSSNAYNIGFVISKIINKLAPIYVKEAVNQYIELESIQNSNKFRNQ